jgi:hypothetical protein
MTSRCPPLRSHSTRPGLPPLQVRVWWTRQMLRGQPDSTPRWEHGRLGRQPEVQLSSKKAGTTLRLTVDYDDSQIAQHVLEEIHIEIEVGAYQLHLN